MQRLFIKISLFTIIVLFLGGVFVFLNISNNSSSESIQAQEGFPLCVGSYLSDSWCGGGGCYESSVPPGAQPGDPCEAFTDPYLQGCLDNPPREGSTAYQCFVTDNGECAARGGCDFAAGGWCCTVGALDLEIVFMDFEPDYIKDTKNQRMFTPKRPFSPYDDIICLARVKVDPGVNHPKSLSGRLLTENGTEIMIGTLSNPQKKEEDKYVYTWKITGNQTSTLWTDNENVLKYLIDGKQVICEVTLTETNQTKDAKEPVTGCVKLWGDGKYKINNIRTKSSAMSAVDIILEAMDNYSNGYHQVDPFKTYKDKFSHYADLVNHDDTNFQDVLNNLSCPNNVVNNIYTEYFFYDYPIQTKVFDNGISNITTISKKYISGLRFSDGGFLKPLGPYAIVHETAHSFLKLYDEYLYGNEEALKEFVVFYKNQVNCFKENKTSDFLPYGNPWLECTDPKYYRTSENSIMRETYLSREFNDWSCGVFLKKVLGGTKSIKDYAKDARDNVGGVDCKSETPTQ